MILRAALEPCPAVVDELRLVCRHLATAGLKPTSPDRLEVVLARFGNVTPDVALEIAEAVGDRLEDMSGCAIAITAPYTDGDLVVADLAGETDRVRALADAVGRAAEDRRIYVDRRIFRTGIVLAEIDPGRPTDSVERMLARLATWHSSAWEATEVSLIRTGWRGSDPVAEVWRTLPLNGEDVDREAQSPMISTTSADA